LVIFFYQKSNEKECRDVSWNVSTKLLELHIISLSFPQSVLRLEI
jgi:hypothetical protein